MRYLDFCRIAVIADGWIAVLNVASINPAMEVFFFRIIVCLNSNVGKTFLVELLCFGEINSEHCWCWVCVSFTVILDLSENVIAS